MRETEPWEQLLKRGREDQLLVHDDLYAARAARTVAIPDGLDWRAIR